MDILILTEGGEKIGFGHITRCISIYEAFEEVGTRPELIINGDEPVSDFVKNRNFKIFDWLNNKEMLFRILKDADIVFVDSYLANHNLYEKISNIAATGVYFDDYVRINYPKGFIINGAISAERMPYPKREGVTYLLGAQYAPLRREFWDVPTKRIHNNIEIAMITFGGADICNLTPKILKLLAGAYPQLNKKVIIGKGFRNISEIESVKDRKSELIYYPDAVGVRKVMLESDIAISAGGQTLYELARIGIPTIGICAAENQRRNIKEWEETGFLKYIGSENTEDFRQELEDALKYLTNKLVRTDMANIGRKIIDGKGCNRIVNKIRSGRQFEGIHN
jgi:spore coat polysaccharide biosynthesis predicted glycosyltransferase SpsG